MPNDELHAGHRKRLRARFRAEGLDSFEPHVILELLLFYGIPRVDVNELAHVLVEQFGGLSEALDASYEELMQVPGITENAATLLIFVPQLFRRYQEGKLSATEPLDSPRKLGEYLKVKFVGRPGECVFLLCLDASLKPMNCVLLSKGTVSNANFSVKQAAECLFRHQACRAVLAHNHPHGIAAPSNEDILVTRSLRDALRPLSIELVDHIIVADNETYSVMEHYPEL